jgi:single-strand DNA-binding protein
MADGYNRVFLLGNLGQDPELKMTTSGQAVLKMRLATTESYLDRNRVRQEKTDWHSVVVWGKRAEALGRFLTKGSRLFIEGSLRTSSFDDRDGNKRYRTEVVASNVVLAGSPSGARASTAASRPSQEMSGPPDDFADSGPGPGPSSGGAFDDDFSAGGDDDIPF